MVCMTHAFEKLFALAALAVIVTVGLAAWFGTAVSNVGHSSVGEIARLGALGARVERAAAVAHELRSDSGPETKWRLLLEARALAADLDASAEVGFDAPAGLTALIYAVSSSEETRQQKATITRGLTEVADALVALASARRVTPVILTAGGEQARAKLTDSMTTLAVWHEKVMHVAMRAASVLAALIVLLVGAIFAQLWMRLIVPARAREIAAADRIREQDGMGQILSMAAARASDSIAVVESNGTVAWCNAPFRRLNGAGGEGAVVDYLDRLAGRCQDETVLQTIIGALTEGRAGEWEIENQHPSGTPFWTVLTTEPIASGGDDRALRLIVERDVTERKQAETRLTEAKRRVMYEATHDRLTGLPNRQALNRHLERIFAGRRATDESLALIHIDLARFKQINDSFGQETGDRILRHAAAQIRRILRGEDFLARVGGDEFIVVVPHTTDGEGAISGLGDRLVRAVGAPVFIEGKEVRVNACAGIGLTDQCPDADALLVAADIAVNQAKQAGEGSVRLYDPGMRESRLAHDRKIESLKTAVRNGDVVAFYQAQVETATGKVAGFELLARWHHPEHGVLPPGAFMDAAAEAGLIAEIDEMVLISGLDGLCSLRAAGHAVPRVSVNASSHSLRDPEFPDRLLFHLDARNLKTSSLAVEILEETLISDEEDVAVRNIERLHELGFFVEMDDFGSGYAAMSNLAAIRLSALKLDRSLVQPLPDPAYSAIVRAIVALARELDMEVIAEGVETQNHLELVGELGCQLAQGYGITRPISLDDTADWLTERAVQARVA